VWPSLLKLGPFTLHTYGALVAGGFLAGYAYSARLGERHGLPRERSADLAWIALLAGIVGARILYVLFNLPYFRQRPLEIVQFWQGGLVWYGGLAAALAVGVAWTIRAGVPTGLAADVFAPGVALGHAVGRLGCFAAGCCYGRPSSLPFAVSFHHPDTLAPMGTPLHPSQLYEAALDFGLFFLLHRLAARGRPALGSGTLACLYAALYSVIRFAVEFSRGDDRGPVWLSLSATQWVALAFLAAAGAWAARRARPDA
jgi:phosphatidylglycerol:prolipoprotein diacylglycerol transferase